MCVLGKPPAVGFHTEHLTTQTLWNLFYGATFLTTPPKKCPKRHFFAAGLVA